MPPFDPRGELGPCAAIKGLEDLTLAMTHGGLELSCFNAPCLINDSAPVLTCSALRAFSESSCTRLAVLWIGSQGGGMGTDSVNAKGTKGDRWDAGGSATHRTGGGGWVGGNASPPTPLYVYGAGGPLGRRPKRAMGNGAGGQQRGVESRPEGSKACMPMLCC